ncbi:threonine ammonia-lyase [Sphingomonas rhizophila]|uniref:threonine ammonia-lyase n=1 Tax=Sphingomonas rhizophila TaxID=2071607 RepID=UPI001FEB04AA|nr:pyridoxal-phosphate dependent enzyme [Sphingomonas rhizophila]
MRSHPELNRDSILAASKRIAGCVKRTPLLECHIDGARIWLKCESLQTGGAFKLRGATNRLLQLSEEDRARGVVAFSSGNHAQGVAIAAKRLDMRATIVMPADAPALKVEGTRAQGADIVFYDRRSESREEIAARIAAEQGSTVVPSFDDVDIITGQGTAGVEIDEQSGGGAVTHIVVPCGGGGLAAGLALALPDAAITIVEPEGWDDMGRSLALGQIVPVEPDAPSTLCDALQTPRVSPLTFGVLQSAGATAVSVNDSEAKRAIGWAWREHGLTLEAGGAVALAAVLTGKVRAADGMVILLSGGNIDPALHAKIIAGV